MLTLTHSHAILFRLTVMVNSSSSASCSPPPSLFSSSISHPCHPPSLSLSLSLSLSVMLKICHRAITSNVTLTLCATSAQCAFAAEKVESNKEEKGKPWLLPHRDHIACGQQSDKSQCWGGTHTSVLSTDTACTEGCGGWRW